MHLGIFNSVAGILFTGRRKTWL